MGFKIFNALNSSIPNVADLVRIKLKPSSIVKFSKEVKNEERVNKIYKGIPNIGLVNEVNRQIKEIILS